MGERIELGITPPSARKNTKKKQSLEKKEGGFGKNGAERKIRKGRKRKKKRKLIQKGRGEGKKGKGGDKPSRLQPPTPKKKVNAIEPFKSKQCQFKRHSKPPKRRRALSKIKASSRRKKKEDGKPKGSKKRSCSEK